MWNLELSSLSSASMDPIPWTARNKQQASNKKQQTTTHNNNNHNHNNHTKTRNYNRNNLCISGPAGECQLLNIYISYSMDMIWQTLQNHANQPWPGWGSGRLTACLYSCAFFTAKSVSPPSLFWTPLEPQGSQKDVPTWMANPSKKMYATFSFTIHGVRGVSLVESENTLKKM